MSTHSIHLPIEIRSFLPNLLIKQKKTGTEIQSDLRPGFYLKSVHFFFNIFKYFFSCIHIQESFFVFGQFLFGKSEQLASSRQD